MKKNIGDGEVASGIVVSLKKSSSLRVRVNEAGSALARASSEALPPHVLVGVFDLKGAFHPALETKRDGAGIDFEIPIPADFPVRLFVQSDKVQLEDDQRAPVPSAGLTKVVVQPASQAQQRTFVFNAARRKP